MLDERRKRLLAKTTTKSSDRPTRGALTEGPATMLQPYWFACQQDDPTIGFPVVIQQAWRLEGPLDARKLEHALTVVCTRHEILRTTYRNGDRLLQIVHPPSESSMPRFMCEEGDAESASQRAQLDLEAGPVAALRLIRVAPDIHVLASTIHHIVFDGPSSALFLAELDAAYRGEALPPLPLQYLDIATYLAAYAESPAGRADIAYWQQRFDGVEPLRLPTDFPRDEVDRAIAAKEPFVAGFPVEIVSATDTDGLAAAIHAATRREGVPHQAFLFAALAATLHQTTGQTDISFNATLNIRSFLGAEALIGGFNAVFFVRIDMAKERTVHELLRAVRDELFEAYEHTKVHSLALVPQHAGRINFGFEGASGSRVTRIGDATCTPISLPFECKSPHDIRPFVAIDETSVYVEMELNPLLFRRETVQALCERFLATLRTMVAASGM